MLAVTRRLALAAALCVTAALLLPAAARAEDITVFAAASMKTALDEVVTAWNAETGHMAVVSYAGSAALAKQIQEGAPADVFISAAVNWMDTLEEGNLIKPETRVDLLGNSIVLVAHGADAAAVDIAPGFDLAGMLGDKPAGDGERSMRCPAGVLWQGGAHQPRGSGMPSRPRSHKPTMCVRP